MWLHLHLWMDAIVIELVSFVVGYKIIFNVWADVPIFIRDGLWVWGSGIESGEGDDPQGGKGIDFWLFGDNSFGAEGAEKW